MRLKQLQHNWDRFGQEDPLWSILAYPDKKNRKWNEKEFFKTGEQEIGNVLSRLKKAGLKVGNQRALDFGCGVGRLTKALGKHFEEVHGVDVSPSMIKLANQYKTAKDGCEYHLNSGSNLAMFQNDSFDFIYSNITLQHIRPKYTKRYIGEFLRILKPNGVLVFQIPSGQKEEYAIKGRRAKFKHFRNTLKAKAKGEHSKPDPNEPIMEMHGIPKDQIVALLEQHGGQLVTAIQDDAAGEAWISLQYTVLKS